MKTMNVSVSGKDYTFRTNNSGFGLFVGAYENSQISCEEGFQSLRRMKKAIRGYLQGKLPYGETLPRIKFTPNWLGDWEK